MAFNRWQEAVVDLFTEIGRIEPLVRTRLNSSRPAGLNENRFIILNHLNRVGSLGEARAALGWQLDMLDGEFDGELDQLVEAGLVLVEGEKNGQSDQLFLSEAGKQTLETAINVLSPEFEQLLSGMPVEKIESAMTTLREIRRTFDNLPDRMGDAA
jgi:DNA-binding MarR family transcriptional regulator